MKVQSVDSRRRRLLSFAGAAAILPAVVSRSAGAENLSTWPKRGVERFLGMNLEFVNGAAPDDPFVEAVSALRPSHVRWPGGEIANYWRWRENRGRPPNYSTAWAGEGVTIEQLARISRRGPAVVVVLNMLTDNLASQLEMLQALGRSGISVAHVELGNEFFLAESAKPDYAKRFPDVTAYVALAENWSAEIRRYFPNLKRAAVGDWALNARGRTWNAAVTDRSPAFDAVTVHWYGKVVDRDNWGDFPHGVVDESTERQSSDISWLYSEAGAKRVVAAYESSIRQFLSRAIPAIPGSLPIWLTEFNKARLLTQLNGTWLHGLIVGSMFVDFMFSERIELATLYNMIGPSTYAAWHRRSGVWSGIAGITSDPAVQTYSASGAAFAFVAHALIDAEWVQVRPLSGDHCRVVLVQARSGWRVLVINLSPRAIDATGWLPAAPKQRTQRMHDPFSRLAVQPSLLMSGLSTPGDQTVVAPYSMVIFE